MEKENCTMKFMIVTFGRINTRPVLFNPNRLENCIDSRIVEEPRFYDCLPYAV